MNRLNKSLAAESLSTLLKQLHPPAFRHSPEDGRVDPHVLIIRTAQLKRDYHRYMVLPHTLMIPFYLANLLINHLFVLQKGVTLKDDV